MARTGLAVAAGRTPRSTSRLKAGGDEPLAVTGSASLPLRHMDSHVEEVQYAFLQLGSRPNEELLSLLCHAPQPLHSVGLVSRCDMPGRDHRTVFAEPSEFLLKFQRRDVDHGDVHPSAQELGDLRANGVLKAANPPIKGREIIVL